MRLIARATALRERIGAPAAPTEQARYAAGLEAARRRLGDQEFDRLWATGAATSLEDIVEGVGPRAAMSWSL